MGINLYFFFLRYSNDTEIPPMKISGKHHRSKPWPTLPADVPSFHPGSLQVCTDQENIFKNFLLIFYIILNLFYINVLGINS